MKRRPRKGSAGLPRIIRIRGNHYFGSTTCDSSYNDSNAIFTARYTVLNFVPKNLYEQLTTITNAYFLFVMILQCIRPISVTEGVPTIAVPLGFVLAVNAVKDAIEDLKRHQSDHMENKQLSTIIKTRLADDSKLPKRKRGSGRAAAGDTTMGERWMGESTMGERTAENMSGFRQLELVLRESAPQEQKVCGEEKNTRRKNQGLLWSHAMNEPPLDTTLWRGSLNGGTGLNTGSAGTVPEGVDMAEAFPYVAGPLAGTGPLTGAHAGILHPGSGFRDASTPPSALPTTPLTTSNHVTTSNQAVLQDWKGKLYSVQWRNIQVGDLVVVFQGDVSPVDGLIVASSDKRETVFIETSSLDGETTLKIKKPVLVLNRLVQADGRRATAGYDLLSAGHGSGAGYASETGSLAQESLAQESLAQGSLAQGSLAQGSVLRGGAEENIEGVFLRCASLSLSVEVGAPSPALNEFSATCHLGRGIFDLARWESVCGRTDVHTVMASPENLLLRGCRVCHTNWVVILVAYVGSETKIRLNSVATKKKTSKLEKKTHRLVLLMFGAMVTLCVIASGLTVWMKNSPTYAPYRYTGFQINSRPGHERKREIVLSYIISFFTWMLLLTNLVPISLVVSMGLIKAFQAWHMTKDINMTSEDPHGSCVVRTSDLNEELGQVQYVMTDKTGTLTANNMEFRKCAINQTVYGEGLTEMRKRILQQKGLLPTRASACPPTDMSATGMSGPGVLGMTRTVGTHTGGGGAMKPVGTACGMLPPSAGMPADPLMARTHSPNGMSLNPNTTLLKALDLNPFNLNPVNSIQSTANGYLPTGTYIPGEFRDPANVAHCNCFSPALEGLLTRTAKGLSPEMRESRREAVMFFLNLAVNHSALVDENDSSVYIASSPDEEALIYGASRFGISFDGRMADGLHVSFNNRKHKVYIEHFYPFDSVRRRSTIIVTLDFEVFLEGKRRLPRTSRASSRSPENLDKSSFQSTSQKAAQGLEAAEETTRNVAHGVAPGARHGQVNASVGTESLYCSIPCNVPDRTGGAPLSGPNVSVEAGAANSSVRVDLDGELNSILCEPDNAPDEPDNAPDEPDNAPDGVKELPYGVTISSDPACLSNPPLEASSVDDGSRVQDGSSRGDESDGRQEAPGDGRSERAGRHRGSNGRSERGSSKSPTPWKWEGRGRRRYVFVKGADSSVFPLCRKVATEVENVLSEFAEDCLRTLVLAYKEINEDTYQQWKRGLLAAQKTNDDAAVLNTSLYLEQDLEYQGITGIEDLLADEVPETVESLLKAGIKIWMLTGDKFETAFNIGLGTNLIRQNSKHLVLTEQRLMGRTNEEIYQAFNMLQQILRSRDEPNSDMVRSGELDPSMAKCRVTCDMGHKSRRTSEKRLPERRLSDSNNLPGSSPSSDQARVDQTKVDQTKVRRHLSDEPLRERHGHTSHVESRQLSKPRHGFQNTSALASRQTLGDVCSEVYFTDHTSLGNRSRETAGNISGETSIQHQVCNRRTSIREVSRSMSDLQSPRHERYQENSKAEKELDDLREAELRETNGLQVRVEIAEDRGRVPRRWVDGLMSDEDGTVREDEIGGKSFSQEELASKLTGNPVHHADLFVNPSDESATTSQHQTIIWDGVILRRCFEDARLRPFIYSLSSLCHSAIFCRTSPQDKGDVVRLCREFEPKATCLAVGDGANDCNMLMAANVGVGIKGREGMQAFNSSDYGMTEFKHLKTLLLVHGRWNYRRLTKMVLHTFYKNFVFCMPTYYYAAFSLFSGQKTFPESTYQLFNVALTQLPVICYGIWDQDVSRELSMTFPQLYKTGIEDAFMRWRSILAWFLTGIWHSVCVFFIPVISFSGLNITDITTYMPNDFFTVSTVMFLQVMLVVNGKLLLETMCPNYLTFVSIGVSFLFLALQLYCLSMWPEYAPASLGLVEKLLRTPMAYLVSFVCLVVALSVDIVIAVFDRTFKPELHHLMQFLMRFEQEQRSARKVLIVEAVKQGGPQLLKVMGYDHDATMFGEIQDTAPALSPYSHKNSAGHVRGTPSGNDPAHGTAPAPGPIKTGYESSIRSRKRQHIPDAVDLQQDEEISVALQLHEKEKAKGNTTAVLLEVLQLKPLMEQIVGGFAFSNSDAAVQPLAFGHSDNDESPISSEESEYDYETSQAISPASLDSSARYHEVEPHRVEEPFDLAPSSRNSQSDDPPPERATPSHEKIQYPHRLSSNRTGDPGEKGD
ncbi:putative ATPase [Gregarina niphandrodes]|uniref:ATPase n=1 Tax=Gregarina niphandrodes TaxID=110365 RepID=A0A023B250_GRENI|nr:putative ATPase [Gregarina niphandrodes]EZG48332.1 putative ATPase [Gregarina niphandrodes]|eukprot:XP_011132102.1 putative ATPase [Gregarina niphandrodes]